MDVNDAIGICRNELMRDLHQITCQYDQIHLIGIDDPHQILIELLSVCIVLWRDTTCRNTMLYSTLQCISACIVADDHTNLCIGNHTRCNAVNDGL